MAEAITFFIESAHLMKELVPLLMYLSVDSTIIIIYYYYWGFSVGEAACTRAHAAGRSRTEEVEVGRGLPPSRGRRPTGGGSACPAPQMAKPRRARREPEGSPRAEGHVGGGGLGSGRGRATHQGRPAAPDRR